MRRAALLLLGATLAGCYASHRLESDGALPDAATPLECTATLADREPPGVRPRDCDVHVSGPRGPVEVCFPSSVPLGAEFEFRVSYGCMPCTWLGVGCGIGVTDFSVVLTPGAVECPDTLACPGCESACVVVDSPCIVAPVPGFPVAEVYPVGVYRVALFERDVAGELVVTEGGAVGPEVCLRGE